MEPFYLSSMRLSMKILPVLLVFGLAGWVPSIAQSNPVSDSAPLPFDLQSPDIKERKAFQLAMMRANDALHSKKYSHAVRFLSDLQPTEKTAQVYKTVLLARAFIGLEDFAAGDSVLASTLSWVTGSTWRNYLTSLRLETFPRTKVSDSVQLAYYREILLARFEPETRYHALFQILRLRGFNGELDGFEEDLEQLVRLSHADMRLDSLYRLVSQRVKSVQEPWRHQALLLAWEEKKGLYENAIKRAKAMRGLKSDPAETKTHAMHVADLYYKNRDFAGAAKMYREYVDKYGKDPHALLQIARSYDKQQLSKKSRSWYDRFLEEYPAHDKTSEIYWLRGWELEAEGKYDDAIEYYLRQLTSFRKGRRGEWANFRIGYCYYKAGNLPNALQFFRNVRDQGNSAASDAGLYWEGRVQEELGDSAAARVAYEEAYRKFHFRFYGQMAKEKITELGGWSDSLSQVVDFGKEYRGDVMAWMRGKFSRFNPSIDRSYESEYVSVPRLLQLKLDTLALYTLETYPSEISSNPWFLFAYGSLLQKQGLWGESYRLAMRLNNQIPAEDMGKTPRKVLKLIYPKPYPDLVLKHAVERNLDPEFIYALMRQESAFDHKIKSWAGAVGLMQIMPATGKALAKRVRLDDFHPYQLTSVDVNIRLGTTYLNELKRKYDDNYFFVLANYNAGPSPAARWKGLHGDKPVHLMVEEISYWETRDYLKKVMGNYWTYRQIWADKP